MQDGLERDEGVFDGEVFAAAGPAVEHAGVLHGDDPRGALHDLRAAARRDDHVRPRRGRMVAAQAAAMVGTLAGEVGVEVEQAVQLLVQKGFHGARSITRSSRGTAVATVVGAPKPRPRSGGRRHEMCTLLGVTTAVRNPSEWRPSATSTRKRLNLGELHNGGPHLHEAPARSGNLQRLDIGHSLHRLLRITRD